MKGNANIHERTIIVVGAGCAGITAALSLKHRGYSPILLERNASVGGMTKTTTIDGQTFELGTVMYQPLYSEHVRRLMEETGLTREHQSVIHWAVDTAREKVLGSTISVVARQLLSPAGIQETLKYIFLHTKHNNCLTAISNGKVPSELKSRFSDELPCLAQASRMVLTGFGYSYPEFVTTFQAIRYLNKDMLPAFLTNTQFRVQEGNQRLWEKAIEQLDDVRTSVQIECVRRLPDRVEVVTSEGVIRGDRIVFAIAPNKAIELMDPASDFETRLAPKVRTTDYRSYLVDVSFPWNKENKSLFVINNMQASHKNRPVLFFYRNYRKSNIATVYVIAEPGACDLEIQEQIKREVAKMKGSVEEFEKNDGTRSIFLASEHWDYFPRVGLEDVQKDVFEDFELLQGKNRSYYVGQFWTFPTVGHSTRNAARSIEKYFPDLNAEVSLAVPRSQAESRRRFGTEHGHGITQL